MPWCRTSPAIAADSAQDMMSRKLICGPDFAYFLDKEKQLVNFLR